MNLPLSVGVLAAFIASMRFCVGLLTHFASLKTANEELQRDKRRARAEGRLPPHEPRWFTSSTDPDTSERLWEPKRAEDGEVLFWAEREKAGQKAKWEGVDHIFVK